MSLLVYLLVLAFNLIIGIQGACEELYSSGDCDFYNQCLGDDVSSDADSVVYAGKHCARLVQYYEEFDEQGKGWNLGVRTCVMTKVYEATNPSYSSFADFEEVLLQSTASCNLNPENSLCDILDTNALAISMVYEYKEEELDNLDYWDIAAEQMIENLLTCTAKHPLFSSSSDDGKVYCHKDNSAASTNSEDLVAAKRTGANTIIDSILESLKKGFTSESSSSPSSTCLEMAEEGNCNFFTECLNSQVACYDEGFALNEGYKFCKKLEEKQPLFKQAGQFWVQSTRECLTKEMLSLLYETSSPSCHYVRAIGLKSLINCVHGNFMCRVIDDDHNVFALSEVTALAQADFFGRNRRRHGLQLETAVTDAMRACYGYDVIPYCLRLIEDGALTVKTKAENVEISAEEGFGDGSTDIEGKPPSWQSADTNCICAGGQCQLNSCSGGQFVTGKCEGDSSRQCCLPDTAAADTCIDSSFLCREEGFSAVGYVPTKLSGGTLSDRGVTIAINVDLGDKDRSYFEASLDVDTLDQLEPYFGLKGDEALETLQKEILALSVKQAMALGALEEAKHLEYIKQLYDDKVAGIGTPGLKSFEELTRAQRTVIASVFYELGDPETCCPALWLAFVEQDWESAKSLLRNFDADSVCATGEIKNRRCREAELLEGDDSSGQNASC